MNKLNTSTENNEIQNNEIHKESKIDKYINWLKEQTTIDLWNMTKKTIDDSIK